MNTPPTLEQFMAALQTQAGLELPPKIFRDMYSEVVAYSATTLRVRFPVQERYQNPMGFMQGGMIVAAIDNTIDPLSYAAAPPSVTMQLNTTFLRPVPPTDTYIEVEARVAEQTRRKIFLEAVVTNPAGKTVALAYATCEIVEPGDGSRAEIGRLST